MTERDEPIAVYIDVNDRALEAIDLSDRAISDLRPLAWLESLRELNLAGTRVSDLAPLAKLRQLRVLNLAGTRVADLSPLRGLANLVELNLANTPVHDLTHLARLRRLERLDCASTRIGSIAPLAELELEELNVASTQVADLAPLAGMATLASLDARGTRIDRVPAIANLRALDVTGTRVAQVPACTQLVQLIITKTNIHKLNHTLNYPLIHLDITNTRIDTLALPECWSRMRTLRLSGTRLGPLPRLQTLASLVEIDLGHLDQPDLECINGMRSLRSLGISHLGITDFGPLSMISLTALDIRWARLQSLRWLDRHIWTLRRFALDVDQATTMLDDLPRMFVEHVTLEGRDRGDAVEAAAIRAVERFNARVELLDCRDR